MAERAVDRLTTGDVAPNGNIPSGGGASGTIPVGRHQTHWPSLQQGARGEVGPRVIQATRPQRVAERGGL